MNVGECAGECGPDAWPEGLVDPEQYWTTACRVATTKTLLLGDDVRVGVVTRCDCRPVRPRCGRVPHYVQHWGPEGTVQVVDIGRCLGRCPISAQECVPQFQESLICADPDSTAQPQCGRFKIIVDCHCPAVGRGA